MRKERLTYRELLRRLSSRSRLSREERRVVTELLADPEAEGAGAKLQELFESMVRRRALLRLAPESNDLPDVRRFLDPETNDRWVFALPLPPPSLRAEPGTQLAAPEGPESPPRLPSIAAPIRESPVGIVHPEPGVARRFLDASGEPLSTFFSIIAARKATDELTDSFEPIRAQLVQRTSATDARIFLLSPDRRTIEPVPPREGAIHAAHLLGDRVQELVWGARETLHVPDLSAVADESSRSSGALVSLPLASGSHIAGMLEVLRETPGAFASEEIDLFALAAQVTAGCLVRAEHLERLIFVDKLTSLYNRAYFDDQIEREIERANRTGTSVALLMADLDHFKRINDTFGHQAGDRALAHLASIFRANIRQIDVAARYGGEEFAILLPSITRARAVRTAERLRRVVADAVFGDVIPELAGMKMSISLGLALYPDDAATSKQLIDRADRVALYAAKNRGRNRVVSWASAREGTESLKSAG